MKKRLILSACLFVCIGCIQAQIPNNGLLRYYPFTGSAADFTPNAQHGVVAGATLTTDRFATPNAAYYFNGTDAYIQIPTTGLILGQYTYSAWTEMSVLPPQGSQYMVLNIGSSGGDQYVNVANNYLGSFYGWGVGGYNADGTQFYVQPPIPLVPQQWVHQVSIRSANGIRFYLNGVLVGVDSTASSVVPSYGFGTIQAFIGLRNNYSLPFKGKIDDVRIYDRPLQEAEVLALYQEGLCLQSIAVTDTLIINTGITNYRPLTYEYSIKIFPNPAKDHIYADFGSNYPSLDGYTLRITNSLGQQMFQSAITQQQFFIDLSTWSGNGTYFVYLIDPQGNILDVRKIILQ